MKKKLDSYYFLLVHLGVMKKLLNLLMFTLVVLTDNGSNSFSKFQKNNEKSLKKSLTHIVFCRYI
jgi:hypothetical protein